MVRNTLQFYYNRKFCVFLWQQFLGKDLEKSSKCTAKGTQVKR